MILLIDLGSQLAEHLDRGFFSLLGVDDTSLPEFGCAQQLMLVIGHARDGFRRLDLLPHESRPRRAPSSRNRSSHELQISTILPGFFERLLDLAHSHSTPKKRTTESVAERASVAVTTSASIASSLRKPLSSPGLHRCGTIAAIGTLCSSDIAFARRTRGSNCSLVKRSPRAII